MAIDVFWSTNAADVDADGRARAAASAPTIRRRATTRVPLGWFRTAPRPRVAGDSRVLLRAEFTAVNTNPKRQRGEFQDKVARIPRLRFRLVLRIHRLHAGLVSLPRLHVGLVFAVLWLTGELRAEEPQTPSGVQWIDPAGIAGSLVIHGGGELTDAVRDKFLSLAGDKEARIVVIPTASNQADSDDPAVRERLLAPWNSLGPADVQLLHTRSKDQAKDDAFVAPLKSATAVWLGGGDQTKIAEAYLGTAVERELLALLSAAASSAEPARARPSSAES